MTVPLYDQDAFRGRDDDVALNSATFNGGGGLNGDWTQDADVAFRIRFVIQEYNNKAANNISFALYFNWSEVGVWGAVSTATGTNLPTALTDDSQSIADNATTTQVIGSGTYGTGDSGGYSDGTTDVPTGACDFSGNDEIEVEFCVWIDSTAPGVANGQTIQYRVELSDGTDLNSYTNTPTVTIGGISAARRIFITHV